jgi:hypothetical protein
MIEHDTIIANRPFGQSGRARPPSRQIHDTGGFLLFAYHGQENKTKIRENDDVRGTRVTLLDHGLRKQKNWTEMLRCLAAHRKPSAYAA